VVSENIHTLPKLRRVIGNSEGEGVYNTKNFKGRYSCMKLIKTGISRAVRGFKPKKPP